MSKTLVIQSHKSPLPYPWIEHCLSSVRHWCEMNLYDYRFMGDELFASVPAELLQKTENQRVVATDLARLLVLRDALNSGYETVIWLDADFLIFNASGFVLPSEAYAVGRENWVQHDKHGKLKLYKKVHNAFLLFRKANSFLDFYIDTAERLLSRIDGAMPPQFIGPKLLTALHNVAILPVMESAGMLSPMVIKDMLKGKGPALELFNKHSIEIICGANICISSCDREEISEEDIEQLIKALLDRSARA